MVYGVSFVARPGTLATFFLPTNTSTRLKECTHGMVKRFAGHQQLAAGCARSGSRRPTRNGTGQRRAIRFDPGLTA
ncbi:hypothetical protein EMIT0P260_130038 [Pseudomonas sp. IT-P260]